MDNVSPKLTPVPGKILLRPSPKKEKIGLIHLPQSAIAEVYSGTVLAVGSKFYDFNAKPRPRWFHPEVKVGDQILFRKWTGLELFYPWEGLMILRFHEVIAILPEGAYAEYKRYPERDTDDEQGIDDGSPDLPDSGEAIEYRAPSR